MDEVIKQAIALVEQKKKPSVPWNPDEPFPQPYYTFTTSNDPNTPSTWTPTHPPTTTPSPSPPITTLTIYSWNIDFMLPYANSRMSAALAHLQTLISSHPDQHTIIFLSECLASDLDLLSQTPWIQQHFHLTDLDTSFWSSGHYGTTMLLDKRLPITSLFRVHFSATKMERDAFFADIALPYSTKSNPTSSGSPTDDKLKIRLCTSHLESLALTPPHRPAQMALIASYLHSSKIDAGIVAGDFNAIQPFDLTLHRENDLEDAFLVMGGREDASGHTWEQQASTSQRETFGTSRMDKVFFTGTQIKGEEGDGKGNGTGRGGIVKCVEFERFGMDVEVEVHGEKEALKKLGFEKGWVTDHLGVKAVFELGG